jgi:hypothetical protein
MTGVHPRAQAEGTARLRPTLRYLLRHAPRYALTEPLLWPVATTALALLVLVAAPAPAPPSAAEPLAPGLLWAAVPVLIWAALGGLAGFALSGSV